MARLIARFWEVQKGSIKIGGIDVKNITCYALPAVSWLCRRGNWQNPEHTISY